MFNDFRYKNVEQVHAFSFWHRQLNRASTQNVLEAMTMIKSNT